MESLTTSKLHRVFVLTAQHVKSSPRQRFTLLKQRTANGRRSISASVVYTFMHFTAITNANKPQWFALYWMPLKLKFRTLNRIYSAVIWSMFRTPLTLANVRRLLKVSKIHIHKVMADKLNFTGVCANNFRDKYKRKNEVFGASMDRESCLYFKNLETTSSNGPTDRFIH
ncbi:hypothetical protein L596_025026 [Steinernema carpocapsae]|uniref:Uncharacterized protein n=2 Tax=Steinernema carpocapsae TaxID=34508 RepID=A0A4U5M6K6_STECR|nr:hypothetical protein L596_025026 [Steinernema carpocapsae]